MDEYGFATHCRRIRGYQMKPEWPAQKRQKSVLLHKGGSNALKLLLQGAVNANVCIASRTG